MNFAKLLQPASFRGIEFPIFDIELAFGRRNQTHEYIYADIPYAEDLGRKGREITINAFLMIDNSFTLRNALVDAIENDSSTGVLVHPTFGSMQVIPKQCKHRYDNREGGIEYLTLVFVEAGNNQSLSVALDTSSGVINASSDLTTSAQSFFANGYVTAGLAQFLAQNARANLNSYTSYITQLTTYGGAINNTSGQFTGFTTKLAALEANASTLVYQPAALAQSITDLNTAFVSAFSGSLPTAFMLLQRLATFGDDLPVVPLTTNLREIEANNQELFIIIIRNSVVAEMIKIVGKTTFASQGDAIIMRDAVLAVASPLLLTLADAFDDSIYDSLTAAVDSMIADIEARIGAASQSVYVTVQGITSALVLAYREYKDASRDLELVSRNPGIINPNYLPPGAPLEILQ